MSGRAPAWRLPLLLVLALLLALLALVLYLARGPRPAPPTPSEAPPSAEGEALELVFLDVGQGDATFIRTPEGKTVLIDGGRSYGRIEEALATLGVEHLDLVVASHADADHIGGLVEAVARFRPAAFMDNGVPHTTATYERLLVAVEEAGSRYLRAEARTITLGAARLTVLPPPHENEEQNDNSVGLVLRYGAFTALLMGDATAAEQLGWLRDEPDELGEVEVYKAAHHGSSTSDPFEFVAALSPQVVVISAGADNPYGHPHAESLATFARLGARVLRTDEVGSVTVWVPSDGGEFQLWTGALRTALPAP